ncbi:MAG: hypothetical protein WBE72_08935 [Terracidiphilus sp.]
MNNDYTFEQVKGIDYIIVRCPSGHRNRGLKAGTQNIRQTLLCAARLHHAGVGAVGSLH